MRQRCTGNCVWGCFPTFMCALCLLYEHVHTHTHALTHTRPHTHAHTHARAQTHIHTHTPFLFQLLINLTLLLFSQGCVNFHISKIKGKERLIISVSHIQHCWIVEVSERGKNLVMPFTMCESRAKQRKVLFFHSQYFSVPVLCCPLSKNSH